MDFSDYLHVVVTSCSEKTDRAGFLKKILVFQKLWKKCQKIVKIEVFCVFLKNGLQYFFYCFALRQI